MQVTVEVTQEIIDAAKPNDCFECVAAIAIKAIVAERCNVVVGPFGDTYTAAIELDGKSWESPPFPSAIAEIITAFDEGCGCEPFRFPLDISEKFLRAK